MSGLGESCSHVASVLWALETGARIQDSMTVTQKKAYWVIPGAEKDTRYAPASQIVFHGKRKDHFNGHFMLFQITFTSAS